MPYHFVGHTGDLAVALTGRSLAQLFGDAAAAFSDSITPLDGVKILIKAVTYHGLHVREADGIWTATVVFDI